MVAVLFSNFTFAPKNGNRTKIKVLKQLLAYWFISLYLLAMARPVVPLLEYIIYEDYIAEFLCINKDKVGMQCNGKCYLIQQLQQQKENKKQNLPRIAMEEYPIGFVNIPFLEPRSCYITTKERTIAYQNEYSYLYSRRIFHPPTKVS